MKLVLPAMPSQQRAGHAMQLALDDDVRRVAEWCRHLALTLIFEEARVVEPGTTDYADLEKAWVFGITGLHQRTEDVRTEVVI